MPLCRVVAPSGPQLPDVGGRDHPLAGRLIDRLSDLGGCVWSPVLGVDGPEEVIKPVREPPSASLRHLCHGNHQLLSRSHAASRST